MSGRLLSGMSNTKPYTYYEEFLKEENEAKELVELKYYEFIKIFSESVNELSEIIDSLSKRVCESNQLRLRNITILAQTNTATFTSISAFSLLQKAHYNDVKVLLRNIVESYEIIVFSGLYPEKVEDWLTGEIKSNEIIYYLSIKNSSFLEGFKKIYGITSKYVHPSKEALSSLITSEKTIEHMFVGLDMFPKFKKEEFIDLASALIFFNGMLLNALGQIFPEYLDNFQIKRRAEIIINEFKKLTG